ncbi:Clavaminate synthase-like protein [Aureobasidium subglaciale]|nr:Clavaminate synthase-like protein [Aureobasidium subglaciale]
MQDETKLFESDLDFDDLPPFPEDVSKAPLLRISLSKLTEGDKEEIDKLWTACCELGFFYLDLRGIGKRSDSATEHDEHSTQAKVESAAESEIKVKIDGGQLLKDAEDLFGVGKRVFDLPFEEKVKYDLKDQGSYFGYKGYGQGVIDAEGTKDRNEFYNVSKDDILGLSDPLPAPELLSPHRDLLRSFIQNSHAVVDMLLKLLNTRLGLPHNKLPSLHKLAAVSGDQVRWVHAPPQPMDDRRTALGQHTDFGSVTILFNRLGGLQVLPPNSEEWCYVKPLRGHAVINLGDAMVKFTAGILRSNTHRVVNPPGEQAEYTRMSLVYFARPADEVLLKVLDGSQLIDEKRQQDPNHGDEEEVTSKEWVLRRALGRRQGGDWAKAGGTESGLARK